MQPGWPSAVGLSWVVSVEGAAGMADGVVVRGAGVGEVCVLVQDVSISTLAQTRKGCFMMLESSRGHGSQTTESHRAGYRFNAGPGIPALHAQLRSGIRPHGGIAEVHVWQAGATRDKSPAIPVEAIRS